MPTTRRLKLPEKVCAHRERLHRLGSRLNQIHIPDVRSQTLAHGVSRPSLIVTSDALEREVQACVDAVSDWHPA